MEFELKERFFMMLMRLKKVDFCAPAENQLPRNEMAVMARASMKCILSEEGVCVSEIHESLYISKAAVSQTLNALEKKGYILRSIDPADRRKIMVKITEPGEAELEKTRKIYEGALDRMLDQFGADSAEELIHLLDRLMNIIDGINEK